MRPPSATQSRAVAVAPAPRGFPVVACPESIARGIRCLLLTHISITVFWRYEQMMRGSTRMGVMLVAMLTLTVLFGAGCASGPYEDPRNFGPAGPVGMTGPGGHRGRRVRAA